MSNSHVPRRLWKRHAANLPSPCDGVVYRELAFDPRGLSQAIEVTHWAFAELVVHSDCYGRVALEGRVGDGAWLAVAVAELHAPLTTLRIPEPMPPVIRARLLDHVRHPPAAALVGRFERPDTPTQLIFRVAIPDGETGQLT